MKVTTNGSGGRPPRIVAAISGGVVIAVLVAVGVVLAFSGSRSDSVVAGPGTDSQASAASVTRAPATLSDSANQSHDRSSATVGASTQGSVATGEAPSTPAVSRNTNGLVRDSGVPETSTSQYASAYSVPVGSSPEHTRAVNPIDLYIPTPDPAYDITTRTRFPPIDNENDFVKWMLANTDQQEKFLRERWVRASIASTRHHITHGRILMAFLLTPREWFARPYNLGKVYENTALPIGYGQTISGPDLVARMTDYLDPQPNEKVLEIGTGSGYQSAFLSSLSNFVYTIEIVKPLAEETNAIYQSHTKELPQFGNIHRRMADGYYGWPEFAPFDKIIVTTGTDHIPPELLKQLNPGGVMIIPVGPPTGQTILKITKEVDKDGSVRLTREDIYHGTAKDIFVPFTAAGGGTHTMSKTD